jgi:tripartite-type tricarboxylate transporter receptor subunit TctC
MSTAAGMRRFARRASKSAPVRSCGLMPAWLAAALAIVAADIAPAYAQAPGDFFRGQTITLLVGSGEGGGFDLSARLTAQFLGRYLPHHPAVVVQNMPGASGLRVAEYVYQVAPRDGTVLAITQPAIVQHRVLNATARFNPTEYSWIGRIGAFVTFGVVWHTAPAQTIEEARTRTIILGAAGSSGPGAVIPAALNQLAGTRFNIVRGYKSASEIGLAIERGEIHGSGSASYEYVSGKGWLDTKQARMLFTIGLGRSSKAPDAPTVVELATDTRGKDIMRLAVSASEIGRSLLAPPGLPPERAAVLRQAFERMVHDPEFIAESTRRGLEVEPLSAEHLARIVADDMGMSADVVDGLRAIVEREK